MLQQTFIHIPGIGKLTEQGMWEHGIQSWDDADRFEKRFGVVGADCHSSRSRGLVVADPGRARSEQRYGAPGLCRLAQNCLAEFWARPSSLYLVLGGAQSPRDQAPVVLLFTVARRVAKARFQILLPKSPANGGRVLFSRSQGPR